MATFSQWLKDQQERQDQVGWAARYWDAITPGKISSVTGMLRVLERSMEHADDAESKGHVEQAVAGIRAAAAEYGNAQLARQARAAGLRVVGPDEAAPATSETGGQAVPTGSPGDRYALASEPDGRPKIVQAVTQLDRIEAKLDALLEALAYPQRQVTVPDEPVTALWLDKQGRISFGQLFAMADLS